MAAAVNSGNLWAEHHHRLLSRGFGSHAWHVHLATTTACWYLAVRRIDHLGGAARRPPPTSRRRLGQALTLIASGLWLSGFEQLGPARLANSQFFGHRGSPALRGGTYRLLKNPIYDAYALGLVALALRRGSAAHLVLAAESYLLLNVVEAAVEAAPFEEEAPNG